MSTEKTHTCDVCKKETTTRGLSTIVLRQHNFHEIDPSQYTRPESTLRIDCCRPCMNRIGITREFTPAGDAVPCTEKTTAEKLEDLIYEIAQEALANAE